MKCVKGYAMQAKGEGTFDLQGFLVAAFAELSKATICFALSVSSHGMVWLPLDRFS
jgi:hypothetical protein